MPWAKKSRVGGCLPNRRGGHFLTVRSPRGYTAPAMPDQLKTIHDFVRWGASRFSAAGLCFGHGTDNAWDESGALVAHALHMGPEMPPDIGACRVTRDEATAIEALFDRRVAERLPAAYLTGVAWFAGIDFEVTPDVLVPRSPIAELIEQGFSPWLASDRPVHVLDMCTGSACIAVATALYRTDARVDAVDISAAVLEVAGRNAARHDVGDRVRLVQGDLFGAVGDLRYDLIVANPPYVGQSEFDALPPEYQREPELALLCGQDGLDIPLRILQSAASHLREGGALILEVGNSEQALIETLPQVPSLWLEFERGGHGVCVLERELLIKHDEDFRAARASRKPSNETEVL